MAAGAKLGLSCKAYLNVGNYGTPNWSAITCISDWKVSAKWDEGDASTRESRLKLALKTLAGVEVSGKMRSSNSGDTNYTTIKTALMADTQLDVMILDGTSTTNGVTGFRFACQVFDGSQDQGLGQVVFDEVMLKPVPNTDGNYNTVLVTAGAAAFTAV